MYQKIFSGVLLLLISMHSLASDKPQVLLTTNKGEILLELDRGKAPKTVENFLRYVNDGFYQQTLFHRVIKGFMVQGGGFTPEFLRKNTHEPIINEASNGLKNDRGTIAMARTNRPHSATSQFFINTVDNAFLNFKGKSRGWGYAVFGKVIKGMQVVDAIEHTRSGAKGPFAQDAPLQDVIILDAKLVKD